MDFNPYNTLNVRYEDPDVKQFISNKIVKACSPSRSNVENILINENSIKPVTEDTTNLNSYGVINIKDEDNDVEEYINNNKVIDKMEIYGMVKEIKAMLDNKEIEKERSTDTLNDNRTDIKVNCNLKENCPGLMEDDLEKENMESNFNDSNNCCEIDVKEEINNKPNNNNIIITPKSLSTDPDVINNGDVDNVDRDCCENDYEMVFDANGENNGTDKEAMLGNKSNDSNWKYTATPVLREFIAMLLGVPCSDLDTVSQQRYLRWCKMCSRAFDRPNKCKGHFIEHLFDDAYTNVVGNKGLKCQICGEVFTDSFVYKSHVRFHASLPVYKCELCNKSFNDSSNFTKHKKVHKTSIRTCDVCQKRFKLKHHLVKHLEQHETTKSIMCTADNCNRVFYSQSSYIRHCRQVHLKQGMQYTCLICREGFMTLKDKWEHHRAKHVPEKPITCDVEQACSSRREPAMDDADKEVDQGKMWKNS